jgi:predicted HTH domain antitoxin
VTTVTLEMPDEPLRTVGGSAEEFGRALRLAAAMYWYGRGAISQEIAASVAGLSRAEFIDALIDAGQPVIDVDEEMLAHELAALKRHKDAADG